MTTDSTSAVTGLIGQFATIGHGVKVELGVGEEVGVSTADLDGEVVQEDRVTVRITAKVAMTTVPDRDLKYLPIALPPSIRTEQAQKTIYQNYIAAHWHIGFQKE